MSLRLELLQLQTDNGEYVVTKFGADPRFNKLVQYIQEREEQKKQQVEAEHQRVLRQINDTVDMIRLRTDPELQAKWLAEIKRLANQDAK